MNKLLLTLAITGMVALHAGATLVGTSANYEVYYGGGYNADATPNLSGLTLAGTGTTPWVNSTRWSLNNVPVDAASPGGENNIYWFPVGATPFSAKLTTSFVAPRSGYYYFGSFSDDGSAAYVDGNLVMKNGGDHSPADSWNFPNGTYLAAGSHTLVYTFFENGVGEAAFTAYADPNLVPVPEPSTWVAGMGVLVFLLGKVIRRKV